MCHNKCHCYRQLIIAGVIVNREKINWCCHRIDKNPGHGVITGVNDTIKNLPLVTKDTANNLSPVRLKPVNS
jgi:hypothetical protein